jgi:hypothetical protein
LNQMLAAGTFVAVPKPQSRRQRRTRTLRIRTFIIESLAAHPHDIVRVTASRFGIRPQSVQHHLNTMMASGTLIATGNTRARTYALSPRCERGN